MSGPGAVEFVAVDLETTGLDPGVDRIIEIGAVRFDATGAERGRYERLVRPDRAISPGAARVHGLAEADLADEEPAGVVLPEFLAWLGDPSGVVLLAHHARFDAGFLGRELARLGLGRPGYEVADTLSLARHRLPTAPNHKLETLAELLGLPGAGPSHRALADSLRVMGVWLALDGPAGPCLRYGLFDPVREEPAPAGWEGLAEAIARGRRVRISYAGGSRGPSPRDLTPTRVYHKGGIAYLAAFCHLDGFEKSFRLDRVSGFEVLEAAQVEPTVPTVSAGAARGARRRRRDA